MAVCKVEARINCFASEQNAKIRRKDERKIERKKKEKERGEEGWLKVDEGQGNFSILTGYPRLFRGRKRRGIPWEEYLRVFKG